MVQVTLTPGGNILFFQLDGNLIAQVVAHNYNLCDVVNGVRKAIGLPPITEKGPAEAWVPSPEGRRFFDECLVAAGLEPANPSIQIIDL